jgi:hypothetical protein
MSYLGHEEREAELEHVISVQPALRHFVVGEEI